MEKRWHGRETQLKRNSGGGVQQESVDVRDRFMGCGPACSRLVERGGNSNEMLNVMFNLSVCVTDDITFYPYLFTCLSFFFTGEGRGVINRPAV